jgi:hypothetical protein
MSSKCNLDLFIDLHLPATKWQHVRYLDAPLHQYFRWTKKLSNSSGIMIHKAGVIFEALFEHLEHAKGLLLWKAES